MRNIVIDTDLGIGNDDCQAVVLALRSPELRVRGISVCAGNLTMRQSLYNALTLVEYLGRPAIAVIPGEPQPLRHEYGDRERAAHGQWGQELEPVWPFGYPSSVEPHAGRSAQWICDLVLDEPGQVVISAIGPLTNLATALTTTPEIAAAIGEIVVLGGCFAGADGEVTGNATPRAEFNFWVDPEAAAIVMSSGVPIRQIPWNIARDFWWPEHDVERIAEAETRTGRLYATLADAVARAGRPIRLFSGDALCVAAILWPQLFSWAAGAVLVSTAQDDSYGESTFVPSAAGTTRVATSCDVDVIRKAMISRCAAVGAPVRVEATV